MISSKKGNRQAIIEEYLIDHPSATLRELGELFGISRQRVHVLLQGMDLKTDTINRWRELTDHELDILRHVAMGYPDQQVADVMGISAQGIRNQLQVIYAKLNVHKRKDAVRVAIKQKLLPQSPASPE
ncbi:LuxR C-terminal-related transcriptional regulator [Chloroflexota bacterium]